MKKRLLVISAFSAEVLGVVALFRGAGSGARTLLGAHLLVSVLVALALRLVLPRRFRMPAEWVSLFLFSVIFLLPGVGALGLTITLLVTFYWPRDRVWRVPHQVIEAPDLPFRPLRLSDQPTYGEGHLVGLLRHGTNADQRLRAVIATRQLSDQFAVPILEIALRDNVDDVRLLAYALLDSKERVLYSRIQKSKLRLADGHELSVHSLNRRMAEDYWELAYQGLAKGEVLTHVLNSARAHAEAALAKEARDFGLCLLLGRVLIRLGVLDLAEGYFQKALEGGLPGVVVYPNLAEVAFRKREFARVRDLLAKIEPHSLGRPPLSTVANYWLWR